MMRNNYNITAQPEYDAQFWAEMRINAADNAVIAKAASDITGGYRFPSTAEKKLSEAIAKESVFRHIPGIITFLLRIAMILQLLLLPVKKFQEQAPIRILPHTLWNAIN